MSVIMINGKPHSFRQYMMMESFAPTNTPYGINNVMDDSKYATDGDLAYTFFAQDNLYYCVYLYTNDGEVAFAVKDTPSLDYHDYTVNRKSTGHGMYVFNKFIYIILTIAADLNLPYLRFFSNDPQLGTIYDKAVRNLSMLKTIEDTYGWKYVGKNENEHIFQHV